MRFLVPLICAIGLLSFVPHGALATDDAPGMAMPAMAGEEIIFDVYRNGRTRFGTHSVRFQRDGEDLLADVSVELRAGLGPVTVFRYEHQSIERWRNNQLVGFSGRTLKDGETYIVQAVATPSGLDVDGRDAAGDPVMAEYAPGLLPSSHWRGYPAGLDEIFNTEHGTLMDTQVVYMGEDRIEADGGQIRAHRYRLSSSLTVDLWYDENGRWAGCEFEARGQVIRYVRRANPVPS